MENEEIIDVDPRYKKGFEIAYWLKKGDNPILKELIEKNANGNQYHAGLLAGKKEAEVELIRKMFKEHVKHHDKDKDKGMEMD